MKKLPIVERTYANLYDMVVGPIRSRLLAAGIELGVFDELDDFRTADEVAGVIGSHPDNTKRFLNALTTIGLLQKHEGRFCNTPESRTFLEKASETYLGGLFQMVDRMCVATLENLPDLVRSGPVPDEPDTDFRSETLWAEATRASAAWVKGFVGRNLTAVVSELPEFAGFHRMLDLGGGHGMFALYFVDAHPSMTGVIFDRPSVAGVAEEFLHQYGMQDRVSVLAGDYLTDDIGSEYDFVWACATLNFCRHDLDSLITKVFNALNPGGVFMSFQDGLTHEQTRPDTMLGNLGHALQIGQDFFFTQGEIADSMLRCGFQTVQSRTLDTPMGAMDLDIARKHRQ